MKAAGIIKPVHHPSDGYKPENTNVQAINRMQHQIMFKTPLFHGYGQLLKQALSQTGRTWWQSERLIKKKCTLHMGTWHTETFDAIKKKLPVFQYWNIMRPKCLALCTQMQAWEVLVQYSSKRPSSIYLAVKVSSHTKKHMLQLNLRFWQLHGL